jgi:hypothetical protein
MKTTYWLVTAVAVAAFGVVVYARFSGTSAPLPEAPLVAQAPAEAPPLELPPVVLPPDETLAMPVPGTAAVPPPLPTIKSESPPAAAVVPVTAREVVEPLVPPASHALPEPLTLPVPLAVPPAPTLPTAPPPVPVTPPTDSTPPVTPPAPVPPVAPEMPGTPPLVPAVPLNPPAYPVPEVVAPTQPANPAPVAVPPSPLANPAPVGVTPSQPVPPPPVLQPPVGVAPAKPNPDPVSAGKANPAPLAPTGRFVVLKDNKVLEGEVSVSGDVVTVVRGALPTHFKKDSVQFVAANRDEVYRFVLSLVSATNPAARLQVARWCMFNGMREQALAEAQEVRKLVPVTHAVTDADAQKLVQINRAAADMVRSLELSLQQFPPEAAPKMTAPQAPTFPAEVKAGPAPAAPVPPIPPAVDSEPDVTPEAALVFGSRVQPFLANQCVGCHGSPDHAGKFKLVRVSATDAGPQATRTNLRAVAAQLRKDDPGASPLLQKALVAHGGMKLPAVESRQTRAFLALEDWVAAAVGTPVPATPVVPASLPSPAAPTPPQVQPPPPLTTPPGSDPLQPGTRPTDPVLPPAPLPVPPLTPPAPSVPPLTPPPAEVLPPVPLPVPAPIAPKTVPVPAGTPFGTAIPPKPPATGPAGGDEFDPAGFNQRR